MYYCMSVRITLIVRCTLKVCNLPITLSIVVLQHPIVQYTTIPLPSKLFKLLVKDLENALEAVQAGNHNNNDDGDSHASSGVSCRLL